MMRGRIKPGYEWMPEAIEDLINEAENKKEASKDLAFWFQTRIEREIKRRELIFQIREDVKSLLNDWLGHDYAIWIINDFAKRISDLIIEKYINKWLFEANEIKR